MNYPFKFINSRQCVLETEHICSKKNNNYFVNDKFQFKQLDFISLKLRYEKEIYSTEYKSNQIELKSNQILITEFNLTETTIFIVPLMFSKSTLLFDNNFINGYIGYNKLNHKIGKMIHLIFRWTPFDYYDNYITLFKTTYNSVNHSKSKDGRFDILSFNVESKTIQNSILKMLRGEFIKFPKQHKEKITKFHNLLKIDELHQMLYNSKEYKQNLAKHLNVSISKELSCREIPDMKKEIWKL